MRISTNSTFISATGDLQGNQFNLNKLQIQLASQKRVVTPSDDPVAASQILELSQSDGRNSQFLENTKAAESALAFSETALSQASDVFTNLKTFAIQAGNGSLTPEDLRAIQAQVRAEFDQLVSVANATDGRGHYLFAGNAIDNPPFVADSNLNVSYQGDSGQRDVQISDQRQIPISQAGSLVYGGNQLDSATGTALYSGDTAAFQMLKDFHDLLGNSGSATFDADLAKAVEGIDKFHQNVLTKVAEIGSYRMENESLATMGEDLNVQYKASISKLEDLDLPKAISDFTLAQTALQYTQLTFQKVQGLSLFNYL